MTTGGKNAYSEISVLSRAKEGSYHGIVYPDEL